MIPTRDQLEQYRLQGFFILDDMADHALLDRIGRDFEALRSKEDVELKAEGARRGINMEGRNFPPHVHEKSEAGAKLCRDPELAESAMSILGPNVRLYWNQAVTKAPMTGGSFSWHQDAGYHAIDPQEYLTLWIPLEDATVENGCIWALGGRISGGCRSTLPTRRPGTKSVIEGEKRGARPDIQGAGNSAFIDDAASQRAQQHGTAASRVRGPILPHARVDPDTGEQWGDDVEVARDGKILADSV